MSKTPTEGAGTLEAQIIPPEIQRPRDPERNEIAAAHRFPVSQSTYESVRDDVVGIADGERETVYAILSAARAMPTTRMQEYAREDTTFTGLLAEPATYRGSVVSIEGDVMRAGRLAGRENRFGIKEVYEAWIVTRDSGNRPYHVIFTEQPAAIPLDTDIGEGYRVRVEGVFLKREGFRNRAGELRTTPLLLARNVRLILQPASPAGARTVSYLAVLGVAAVLISLAITVWRFVASDARFRRTRTRREYAATAQDIEALSHLEAAEPDQFLRRLAANEQRPDVTGYNQPEAHQRDHSSGSGT